MKKFYRRAAQMRTDGDHGVYPLAVANDPHPLFFLQPRTHLAHLVIRRYPGLKLLGGFIQNPREEKAERGDEAATPEGRETAPPDIVEETAAGAMTLRRSVLGCGNHNRPFFSQLGARRVS
jgi:hypothetical protein